ncbi:hypothetical protein CDCA_CDCA17G4445 [Cyanidium caldarium]|uniref:Peroxisomal membrane protein MPV17 n=1 Tax=Cyanidium caldarium TaxID=2771 RepID=A0AAV9J254_CYACA|nr:hypothetical protein CDCA_CDCA17G4445 [Cyanidium caldarium]
MLTAFWARYNQRLAEKPLQVKTLTSFFGFTVGDLVAQMPALLDGKPWDAARTARMASFGLLLHGPIGHYWYNMLDRTVMPHASKSTTAVVGKMAIDQLLWAPVFTSMFFSYMEAAEGHPERAPDVVREKLWPTLKVNWTVWPLAHLINFRFVPSSQRILYINTVQVGYNAFLSTMAAAKGAEGESPEEAKKATQT